MEESTIKLIVKEGKEIEITKKQAELSDLLKSAINEYPNETSFPLNELAEKDIEYIKEYLSHYNGEPPKEISKPLSSNEISELTDQFSAEFITKISVEDLPNLTMAANYMGIKSLFDLCCTKVALLCKDKSEEEIFKTLNITETSTEEEKKKIKEDNKWIEENL